jgi:hypothetical protein
MENAQYKFHILLLYTDAAHTSLLASYIFCFVIGHGQCMLQYNTKLSIQRTTISNEFIASIYALQNMNVVFKVSHLLFLHNTTDNHLHISFDLLLF